MGDAPRPRRRRAPSLRFLVKLALRCDSAEQLGLKLRRRFERQQRRQATAGRRRAAEREIAEVERLLAQD